MCRRRPRRDSLLMGDNRLHAVVVGGGLAGLAAALFLGRRGHQVTVVERDQQVPAGGPDAIFSARPRPGVPQVRQPHNFLGRSVRVLRAEAPDVLDTLVARGALRIPLDLGEGPGDAMLCARRPLFESVIRQATAAEPNVSIRDGVAVTGVLVRPAEVPIVTGVVTRGGDTIRGDLVIDAAGRRSPLPALLQAHGTRPALTTSQDCGLMYISRYYRLRPGCGYPKVDSPIMAVLDWARSMAFPADNGTFALLATVTARDPLRRALCTENGFDRFHAAVPAIAPWALAGEPISGLRAMGRLENRYRRLTDSAGPIVGGLVPLGDSALHTNPTAGRGVSLAFAQAQHLATTFGEAADPISYAAAFDAWTDANVGAWYGPQAQADASLARRMQAAVDGRPSPPPEPMERLRLVIFNASRTDADVALPLRRMIHLVSLPKDVIGNETVRAALNALIAARPELTARAAGPRREVIAAACA
jgi:2-polyprenyl-6-methoxyphenol hydroxylase-like FAD-dependent oxidoreductase